MLQLFSYNVVNDKKSVLGILKIYRNFRKRTPDGFNHFPQAQVSRILKKHPILSGYKKVFNGITKLKSILTRKKYKKQVIGKNQVKQINKTEVLFCTPGKKGISMVQLLLDINALKIHNSYAV